MHMPMCLGTPTPPCECRYYTPNYRRCRLASLLTGLGLYCFCLPGRTRHRRHHREWVHWEVVLHVEAMRNQFIQWRDLQAAGQGSQFQNSFNNWIFFIFLILKFSLFMVVAYTHATAHTWRSEDNLWTLVLSFHPLRPRN